MKIPEGLPAGTKLWYSKTEFVTITPQAYGPWTNGRASVHCQCPPHGKNSMRYMRYYLINGMEVYSHTPPIIRIERIASAPAKKRAKVDEDARFLIEKAGALEKAAQIASWPGNMERRKDAKRFRAIARRLNGEGKL